MHSSQVCGEFAKLTIHEEEPRSADAAPVPPPKAYNAALDQHMMLPQAEQQYLHLLKKLGLSARSVLALAYGLGSIRL